MPANESERVDGVKNEDIITDFRLCYKLYMDKFRRTKISRFSFAWFFFREFLSKKRCTGRII